MATKEETILAASRGQGCLGKAHPDEPVFVLRASDQLAPEAILYWATLLENRTNFLAGDGPPKAIGARAVAKAMKEWQAKNGCKVPD